LTRLGVRFTGRLWAWWSGGPPGVLMGPPPLPPHKKSLTRSIRRGRMHIMRDAMRTVSDGYHLRFRDGLIAAPLKLFVGWYERPELSESPRSFHRGPAEPGAQCLFGI
jgi:hypothetical protein